jgi:hypothetical protein
MRCLTVLLLVSFFVAGAADAGELTPGNLARATRFVEAIRKVYDEGKALSRDMNGTAGYIDSYHAGDVDPEEFADALNPFLAGMRVTIADYRTRYPRAPLSPSLGSLEHERSLDRFAKLIVKLGRLLARQLDVLYQLRDAALAGDNNAYDIAVADSLAVSADLILAENRFHEGVLATVEPENPRRGFIRAIVGGNEVTAVALRIIEAGYRGREFDAGKYALEVETGLRDVGRSIIEGENAARRMLKDLEGKFAVTEADRYRARYTGELVMAYERAFALERIILEIERGLLDYLRAVNAGSASADDAMEEMLDFYADLDEKIQQRREEENIRQAMADEYSRALEALRN